MALTNLRSPLLGIFSFPLGMDGLRSLSQECTASAAVPYATYG